MIITQFFIDIFLLFSPTKRKNKCTEHILVVNLPLKIQDKL